MMRGLCCKPPKKGFFAGWERGCALHARLEAREGRANVCIVSEEKCLTHSERIPGVA